MNIFTINENDSSLYIFLKLKKENKTYQYNYVFLIKNIYVGAMSCPAGVKGLAVYLFGLIKFLYPSHNRI